MMAYGSPLVVVLAPRPVIIRNGFASDTKSRNRILPRSLTHCGPRFHVDLLGIGPYGPVSGRQRATVCLAEG